MKIQTKNGTIEIANSDFAELGGIMVAITDLNDNMKSIRLHLTKMECRALKAAL